MTSMTSALRLTLRACSKARLRIMLKTWHRTIGLIASVFLLALTVTGLALMQTDQFNLDSRFVASEGMLDWYGVRPAPPPLSFSFKNHWLTQLGERLYFDAREVTRIDGQLIGVVPLDGEILLATTSAMMIVTAGGELAERLDGLNEHATEFVQLGLNTTGQVVLRSSDGLASFDANTGELATIGNDVPVRWSLEATLPGELSAVLARDYRGQGLSIERVLLDLHTGRLFGTVGVLLVNTASILLLVLIISGFVLWLGRKRQGF